MLIHTYSCPYPEGCSCGASAYNAAMAKLEAERDQWKATALELGVALREVGKLVDDTPPEEFRYSDHAAIKVNTALATLDKLTK